VNSIGKLDEQPEQDRHEIRMNGLEHARKTKTLKVSNKAKGRRAKLIETINKLKFTQNRLLPITANLDMMKLPRYDLLPLIMPVNAPQVSDARITVQTFNPPSMPLEPGMVPAADYHYNVTIPEIKKRHRQTKEINLSYHGKFTDEMKSLMVAALNIALEKHHHAHVGSLNESKDYVINVFETPTDRYLHEVTLKSRVKNILARIKSLKEDSDVFQQQVSQKMQYLDFLLSKYQQTKLAYIVN
jgi:hypothetical protein